jgi:enamine deaminase RidA (YjgF/YER057c/UK114 family)
MRAIVPPEYREAVRKSKISPGLLAGDYLFLTGMTGSGPGGLMPAEPEAQFRQAFAKIGAVLAEAGLDFRALVEMTSYHVGLRDHFALFDAIRLDHVNEPYPAWTAVEVAGLRREGAIVEIRAIAWSGREG